MSAGPSNWTSFELLNKALNASGEAPLERDLRTHNYWFRDLNGGERELDSLSQNIRLLFITKLQLITD